MTSRSGLRLDAVLGPALHLVLLAAIAAPVPARAETPGRPDASALCDAAIAQGARRGGVPTDVLYAVALTETGQHRDGRMRAWPWAINREGKGHWFKSRDEALAFGKASLAAGRRSFDVGCVQINYRWHGHAFPSLEDMLDPEWTATYAAQFLRTLYEERGSWSEAAGAYHSLTPDKAMTYRARFDRLLSELDPGALTDTETLVAAAQPQAHLSTRQARREAQRRAMAERIRAAGSPPPPLPGGIAGVFVPAAGALITQGAPLLYPGQPLLSGPPGSLF
jgi:Transglycosylase SLT domain